jgi:hypothetical protein
VHVTGEIEDRLHNIESQMADQLNVVKTMLLNIEDKLSQQVPVKLGLHVSNIVHFKRENILIKGQPVSES